MGAVVDVVAFVVTLVAVLAAAGHAGYLGMLVSAAKKRPGGQPAIEFARKRLPVAGATLGITLMALLLSLGGIPLDIFAMLLAAGGGIASLQALRTSQSRLQRGQY